MHIMMIRAKVKNEHVADLEASAKTMFAAIEQHHPSGVKYASSRVGESDTYVIMLGLETPGQNPLGAIPEFQAFQAGLRGWLAEPPSSEVLSVVGSYNLF
jgi:hypothetical protein